MAFEGVFSIATVVITIAAVMIAEVLAWRRETARLIRESQLAHEQRMAPLLQASREQDVRPSLRADVDCVAYTRLLFDLRAEHPGDDLIALFEGDLLSLGRAERVCGDAATILGVVSPDPQ